MQEFSDKNSVPLGTLFDVCVVLDRGTIVVNDGEVLEEKGDHSYLWLEQEQDNLFLFMASIFRSATGFLSTPPALERYFEHRELQPKQNGFIG